MTYLSQTTLKILIVIVTVIIIVILVSYWTHKNQVKSSEHFEDMPAVVNWKAVSNAGFSTRAYVGSDGVVRAITSNDALMSYVNNTWVSLKASFKVLSVRDQKQMVGLTRTSMAYYTTDITITNPTWIKLQNSRFDSISIGYDGTIWATVLPVGGSWGIYSYDSSGLKWKRLPGSLKQVSVRTANEAWGVAADDGIWKWNGGGWVQIEGALRQIAVGNDGDVWGVNKNNELWNYTKQKTWQKAAGQYRFVDVKDASMLVAVDMSYKVVIGQPQNMATVVDPIETNFTITAYSGGNGNYSDWQQSQTGWAVLSVNNVDILNNTQTAYRPPGPGLNVVTIAESGQPLSIASFDTGTKPSANNEFATFLSQIQTSTRPASSVNLYNFSPDSIPDGSNTIQIKNKTPKDIATANVMSGKYDLSFAFTGNGKFLVGSSGAKISIPASANNLLNMSLTAGPTSQTFKTSVTFTTAGPHTIQLSLDEASIVSINNLQIIPNTDDSYPPNMMFILAHADAASSLSSAAFTAVQSFGGALLNNLKAGGSYYLIYDFVSGRVIDENLDNAGHVKFISQGRYPVFDSTYVIDNAKSPIVYMMNKDTVIGYDITNAKIISSVSLQSTVLPPPFNKEVDSVITVSQETPVSLILIRGPFWIKVKSDFSVIMDGPSTIGTGAVPISASPFTQGINATVQNADQTRYFFKDQNYLQTTATMDKTLTSGYLGSGDFVNLPKAFSRIHAAFPSVNGNIGLVSFDKLIFYNTQSKSIAEGPINILTDKRFTGLPISFRIGVTKPAVPFLNHTRFSGQKLKNFDISVGHSTGTPGWNPLSFTSLNSGTVFNSVSPPIKVSALLNKYPDVAKTVGTDTNLLLTAYERNTTGWDVPRYGGNTASFVLVNKKSSGWISYADSGNGYQNADMASGEWYILSIWVRTEDSGFSVGASTGSPATLKANPAGNVNLIPLKVNSAQGWQLLSWEFHHPSTSKASDVSFSFAQDSLYDTIHSLYGPVLKAKINRASTSFVNELIKLPYFYLQNTATKTRLGYDGQQSYTCSKCSTINGQFGLKERLCAYAGKTPGTIILGSYAEVKQGSLNMCIDSTNNLIFADNDDAIASWILLQDENNAIYIVNVGTDMILSVSSSAIPVVVPCPSKSSDLSSSAFSVQLKSDAENFTIQPVTRYIEAAFACNADSGSTIYMFRRGVVCSFDVNSQALNMSPTKLTDHSSFQNLPARMIANIDTCFQLSGYEIFIFDQDRYVLWDISTGTYSAKSPDIQTMGPGGHDLFEKLPAPFNKHLDASAKLDTQTVLLISDNQWLRWDLKKNVPLDNPQYTNTGLFQSVSDLFSTELDSAVEHPSYPGQVFLFSGTNWTLYDFISQKTTAGPDVIGSDGDMFADLIPPFVPSQAEICQGYQNIIVANTDYRKTKCVEDSTREFQWQQQCMFDNMQPTCDQINGVYNDDSKLCGTLLSKGQNPIKKVDSTVRTSYINRYLTECQTVSEWDYRNMKTKESEKQRKASETLEEELAKKQSLLKNLDNARKNIAALNEQLASAKLTFSSNENDACDPIRVCLKPIDHKWGRTIPLGCNQSVISSILQKDTMSQSDIDVIADAVKQSGILNTYDISQHPDYSKYVKTREVKACLPNNRRATVADFSLASFPSYYNYISADKLLPASSANNANSTVAAATNGGQLPATFTSPSSVSTQTVPTNSNPNALTPTSNQSPSALMTSPTALQPVSTTPQKTVKNPGPYADQDVAFAALELPSALTLKLQNSNNPSLVTEYQTFIDKLLQPNST